MGWLSRAAPAGRPTPRRTTALRESYIHTFSFIELLNRGRHSALWKWRPPRHDGRRFRARLWIDLVYLVLLLLTAGPLNPLPFPSHNP